MTPDQISKLPPELQRAADYLERAKIHVLGVGHWQWLDAALTWGLQMQEERDQIKNHRSIAQAELRAAEATIATLTREKEQLTNEIIRLNCTPQAVPTSVDNKIKVFRFPSHTPEGRK